MHITILEVLATLCVNFISEGAFFTGKSDRVITEMSEIVQLWASACVPSSRLLCLANIHALTNVSLISFKGIVTAVFACKHTVVCAYVMRCMCLPICAHISISEGTICGENETTKEEPF